MESDEFDYLEAAEEMAKTGRPHLAHFLAEEAAVRTGDEDEAERIRRDFPRPDPGR